MNKNKILRVSVPDRLERLPLTGYQKRIFALIAAAWLFDSIDLAMLTFILGSIKTDFGLSAQQAGLLATMSFIGMAVGASVSGILSDKFGRKVMLQNSILVYSGASILCALAQTPEILGIFRFLVGFGLGTGFPPAMSLVSEFIPSKDRGRYIAILEGFWPIGFICAGILAYFLIPFGGWRLVFLAEAVPVLYYFVVKYYISESPRWLEDKGRLAEADKVVTDFEEGVKKALGGHELPVVQPRPYEPDKQAVQSTFADLWAPGYVKRTVMIWSLWFFALLGYYGLTTWLGTLLQQKGFEVTKSVFYTVAISFGGIPGFLTSAYLVEALGRKPTNVIFLFGAALGSYLYGTATTLTSLVIFGFIMQFFMLGMWSCMYAYTPELYPTRARATGSGFASAVGRLGAIVGAYLVGVILPHTGIEGVFALGAVCYAVAAVAVVILGEETKGKSLENISG
ncbi:MFS transporter [Sporomusa sp. KB1]|jgi:putative MFS transporter|uniref:MFS transporter n=1 Tax=Sporomusa sp. KB1 TaxID=943346 RepID=UPI0011A63483|nr:MFS transporter [Sporomusa sp. KB1]TWH46075.1 putative MFS transporter [Sporomusa sp. KB1]